MLQGNYLIELHLSEARNFESLAYTLILGGDCADLVEDCLNEANAARKAAAEIHKRMDEYRESLVASE